jgi:diguanylate cyclase (GGDEF)-like protein
MQDTTRRAVRLLEQAQTGDARTVLTLAESILGAGTGAPADGPACMHFVRAVAFIVLGDLRAGLDAVDLMLHAAEREGSAGWQACALATRASERLRLGEQDSTEYDVDGALRDLAAAEVLVADETDPIAAVNARVGIAVGYYGLRLYELVGAHFQAAYEISAADPDQNGNRSMWLTNLADLHLNWALELYQVGQVAEAEWHTAEAERYAMRAAAEASGADAPAWRDSALLAAACARADREDPAGAAVDIEHYTAVLQARGWGAAALAYSRPFRAVALKRAGRAEEALRVIERAVADLPPDAGWLITAATHRTHAVLLSARAQKPVRDGTPARYKMPGHGETPGRDETPTGGGAAAGAETAAGGETVGRSETAGGGETARGDAIAGRVGLAYGDTLAATLWRQRQRTLHTAETMQSLETLRAQHEQAARAAEIDVLTGIANRRAFDAAVQRWQGRPDAGDHEVTALIIDMDRFKQINDTRGHAAGDLALREVAAALAGHLREQDLLARLGGDEFGALLTGVEPADAADIAARMVQAVRDIPDCPATVSIGVAGGPADLLSETLCRADEAMYRAKRQGGDAVRRHRTGVLADRSG